jgi:CubicO group peptidase (beta-lactamase class C family)
MKHWFGISLLLCSFVAFAQKKSPATPATDARLIGLDAQLEAVLKASRASSFAVAIVDRNQVIYAKGFGYSHADKKIAASPQTLYAIGSCTKAFTASLMGLLQKSGKVDFDKPVREYLPELKFYNDAMNNSITLRDMMSHRTGLPRHDFSWYLFPTTRDSLLQRIQYQEPTLGPRLRWQYNNFMFLAQGKLAEKMWGKSWEQITKEQLLTPLGMQNSYFTAKDIMSKPELAVPYGLKKDSSLKQLEHYPINGMGPAGSIYSSVSDMARWVQCWINGGKLDGKEVLPASYVKEAISSQMVVNGAPPGMRHPDIQFSTYGFGWTLTSYKGHYRVEHGGNIDGFSASTSFFPTDSVGIVVLVNQDESWVPATVRNIIADRLLKTTPYDWLGEQIKDLKRAKAAADSAGKATAQQPSNKYTHPLADYAGLYNHPGYGTMDLFVRNDSLLGRTSKYDMWLEPWNYDVFVPYALEKGEKPDTAERPSVRLQFLSDVNGEISHFRFIGIEDPTITLDFKRQPRPATAGSELLRELAGTYVLPGLEVSIYVKNETLYALVPGQPDYELVYLGNDKFKLKVLDGYYLQFDRDANKAVKSASFIQPNGTFTAIRKL